MGELLKTAQSKRTSPEAQQQIVALVGSWAADAEYKRNPLLAAQFGASHEQLTAQAAGRPQMAIFSPLVAEHGDHDSLLAQGGIYAQLWQHQQQQAQRREDEPVEVVEAQ